MWLEGQDIEPSNGSRSKSKERRTKLQFSKKPFHIRKSLLSYDFQLFYISIKITDNSLKEKSEIHNIAQGISRHQIKTSMPLYPPPKHSSQPCLKSHSREGNLPAHTQIYTSQLTKFRTTTNSTKATPKEI